MTLPVYQIVGYKNSGKTTLMEKLIQYFSNLNMEVGTLKHHGHGGPLKTVESTDSYRHSHSGARISAAQGDNKLQLTIKDTTHFHLNHFINMYTCFNVDLLLIEGYKYAKYPKIVLIKNEEDTHLLNELTNIMGVGVRDEKLIGAFDQFTFLLNQVDEILPELVRSLCGEEK